MTVQISVQGDPANHTSCLDLARSVDEGGFHTLYVADHPGTRASPFVALGRTLDDGHRHAVEWSRRQLDDKVGIIRSIGQDRSCPYEIEVLVQAVVITDERVAAANALAETIDGATVEDLLAAPYLWVGTVEEIADQLADLEARYGITRHVVRAADLDAAGKVLAHLE